MWLTIGLVGIAIAIILERMDKVKKINAANERMIAASKEMDWDHLMTRHNFEMYKTKKRTELAIKKVKGFITQEEFEIEATTLAHLEEAIEVETGITEEQYNQLLKDSSVVSFLDKQ